MLWSVSCVPSRMRFRCLHKGVQCHLRCCSMSWLASGCCSRRSQALCRSDAVPSRDISDALECLNWMPRCRYLIRSPLSTLAALGSFLCAPQQLPGHALSYPKTGWDGWHLWGGCHVRRLDWPIKDHPLQLNGNYHPVHSQDTERGHICQELERSTASLEKQPKMTCQEIFKLSYIHAIPKVKAGSHCGLIPVLSLCGGSLFWEQVWQIGAYCHQSALMFKFRLAEEKTPLSGLYKHLKYVHNITALCMFFYQQLIVFPLFPSLENYKS